MIDKIKSLFSKRLVVAVVMGGIIILATLQNTIAMVCLTTIAITYIVCETIRKS